MSGEADQVDALQGDETATATSYQASIGGLLNDLCA